MNRVAELRHQKQNIAFDGMPHPACYRKPSCWLGQLSKQAHFSYYSPPVLEHSQMFCSLGLMRVR